VTKSLRERTIAWALASESAQRIRAMLEIAKHLPPITDDGYGWNAVLHKLAVGNCVINLRTGAGERGVREDKISLGSDVPYIYREADTPRWERFLVEIFPDAALREYIQLAVGYSATGETSEQCFFLCYGAGANGKTTFLSAIRYALGELAYTLPFAVLERSRAARENASPYLADLEGRRFVTASEVNDNTKLDEGRIKELTGEGVITARRLYKAPFTYLPQLKLWLAVNHKPHVSDDSDAFWRRVRFVPFLKTFKGDAIDATLNKTLLSEAPGILRWIVDGAVAWYAARDAAGEHPVLSEVPGSAELTREWRGESDPIQEFINDKCIEGYEYKVARAAIYVAYDNWCVENHVPYKERLTRTGFIRRLTPRYEYTKIGGIRYLKGVGLIDGQTAAPY